MRQGPPKLRIGAKLLTTSEPRPMAVVAAASVQGSHPMRRRHQAASSAVCDFAH